MGSRRTGVAISDELGMFAHVRPPLTEASREALIEAVARLVAAEAIDEVIVGIPLGLHGRDTAQTADVRSFVYRLRQRLSIRVSEWDERLSTVEAARQSPGRRRARDGSLDSAAAALVLQAVIDARRGPGP